MMKIVTGTLSSFLVAFQVFALSGYATAAFSPNHHRASRPKSRIRHDCQTFGSTSKAQQQSQQLWGQPRSYRHDGVNEEEDVDTLSMTIDRRRLVKSASVLLSSLFGMTTVLQSPRMANALVKGNAPPPKKKANGGAGGERKCQNVEECQEMAERRAAAEESAMKANMEPLSTAPKGTRYRDMEKGNENSAAVAQGKDVTIFYKVLKLGKRSYDGVSGEGTVVFSRGYGLEDDEKRPGDKSFAFTVGDSNVIAALSDGMDGMHVGGTRRISVSPQRGWEKPGQQCDGGPGGSGSGGDLKTDYVVVPTATMVATEICFDKTKFPFPTTYAEERRMAQRFDQSLIIEVELVDLA